MKLIKSLTRALLLTLVLLIALSVPAFAEDDLLNETNGTTTVMDESVGKESNLETTSNTGTGGEDNQSNDQAGGMVSIDSSTIILPELTATDETNHAEIIEVDWSRPNPALVLALEKKLLQYQLEAEGKSQTEIDLRMEDLEMPNYWESFSMPRKGNVKIPVFLVDFPDYPYNIYYETASKVVDAFNYETDDNDPYISVNNYYKVSSYNQLDLTFTVYGWVRAPQNRDYYTKDKEKELIEMILDYWDPKIDFSQYDSNSDSCIDGMYFIFTGPKEEGTVWWPHANGLYYVLDGKSTAGYAMSNYDIQGQSFDLFYPIHEIGHCLGLPDYYDYYPEVGPAGGVGGADMMDSHWGDHNCFSKYLLGWIEPTVIQREDSEVITLRESGSYPDAVVVLPYGWITDREFFMAQYRYPGSGMDPNFEVGLVDVVLEPGLWIWHVDATLDDAGYNYLYDNSAADHKLLRLMEADGLEEIETSPSSLFRLFNNGDLYTEGDRLTPLSNPNSSNYQGLEGGGTDVWMNQLDEVSNMVSPYWHGMRARFTVCSACTNLLAADFQYTWEESNDLTINITDTSLGNPDQIFIVWGDGSPEEEVAGNSITHSYGDPGEYAIRYTVVRADAQRDIILEKVTTFVVTDLITIFRNGEWYVDMNRNFTWDDTPVDQYRTFGMAGDKGIVGDWNGDGVDRIGVFRNGEWYLDIYRNFVWDGTIPRDGTIYDWYRVFGIAGDIPVSGDWNRDGIDEIGVYRNGEWYFDQNGNFAWDGLPWDAIVYFGFATDKPVVGDWNDDGLDEIGVFRNGEWYLDMDRSFSWSGTRMDRYRTFGTTGDIPVVGDWNEDGLDEIGVFRNGEWYLDADGSYSWPTAGDLYRVFGIPGDTPLVLADNEGFH